MQLSANSKLILKRLSLETITALEELKDVMALRWAEASVKADNEFNTLWALAERESKHKALVEFLQDIRNMT